MKETITCLRSKLCEGNPSGRGRLSRIAAEVWGFERSSTFVSIVRTASRDRVLNSIGKYVHTRYSYVLFISQVTRYKLI